MVALTIVHASAISSSKQVDNFVPFNDTIQVGVSQVYSLKQKEFLKPLRSFVNRATKPVLIEF